MRIKELFKTMVGRDASDMYLRNKAYPRARIHGKVEVISNDALTTDEMTAITNYLLASEYHIKLFRENKDIDFVHVEPDIGRFRVNIFMQRQTPAIVCRYVHSQVKTFDNLHLPEDVCKLFCEESKGLLLVCGPAGNGKSTTIASMVDYINEISSKHIITIEDPIEFLFQDKKSIINQRELGLDVPSYITALKHVTQQSPDIIYIGNIRDVDTMRATITATELGTFCLTTFHTINAVQSIIRMINFFPPHMHDEIRMQLSLVLKGTISLRLIPNIDGTGRVPACETMVVTPTIARMIRENTIGDIQSAIDDGKMFGMQSFKTSLVNLVKEGMVDQFEARKHADSKDEFDLAMKGIKSEFK